jgi:hypothetical protein
MGPTPTTEQYHVAKEDAKEMYFDRLKYELRWLKWAFVDFTRMCWSLDGPGWRFTRDRRTRNVIHQRWHDAEPDFHGTFPHRRK